jgi:hypothetical protein
MLPNDILDLVIATVLLIFFVSGGVAFDKFGLIEGGGDGFKISDLDDDKELFVLNYLKVNTNEGIKISELILDAENDESKFEILIVETERIMEFNFVESYDVRIFYSGGEKRIGNEDLEEFYKIKMPDKNGNLILVNIGIIFGDETI